MTVLNARLRALGFPGRAAVLIQDAVSGETLHAEHAGEVLPAASLIKLPLLVRGLWAAQQGQVPLHERLTLRDEDRVPGSGVLHELGAGLTPTWQDLLTLMTVVSDNTATNMVIEHLGLEATQAWLARDWPQTRLVGPLQRPAHRQNDAQRRGLRNTTTAHQTATLLGRLYRGELLDAPHTHLALDLLGRQHFRDILGRGVPPDHQGEPLYRVLSKSGELPGVHHDAGLLLTPRPLCVAVLSVGGEDLREHPDNRDVRRLSAALWPLLAEHGQVTSGDILPEPYPGGAVQ